MTAVGLLVLYSLLRPALAKRAFRWVRTHTRLAAIVGISAAALVGVTAFAGDQLAHPTVGAAEQADDWSTANSALARVAAADLRWHAAGPADRAALVEDVRNSTHRFSDAVSLLERIRPPEEGLSLHRSATAVYREMADVLSQLPGALADGDTARAATIWGAAATLGDEAATFIAIITGP